MLSDYDYYNDSRLGQIIGQRLERRLKQRLEQGWCKNINMKMQIQKHRWYMDHSLFGNEAVGYLGNKLRFWDLEWVRSASNIITKNWNQINSFKRIKVKENRFHEI